MKSRSEFVCNNCGAVYHKWAGKCDACQEWNTITEETAAPVMPKGIHHGKSSTIKFESLESDIVPLSRLKTTIEEFDRVCGGGIVPGSAILIGGDPGIGKSTLLLQILASLSQDQKVFYVSGEESLEQIKLRARRLSLEKAPIELATENKVDDIIKTVSQQKNASILVIDSIQTMFCSHIESAPGSVSQVRTSAAELIMMAKKKNIALILVGHVTKEGNIAGPKVLEHMVDTVLYFDGDANNHFRILRAIKNRFGAANELGIFEMAADGLREMTNPSSNFLLKDAANEPGSVIYAAMEGTRPLLCEIQTLVTKSVYATPKRTVVGWDPNRLSMMMAVLEARGGVAIGFKDVYLNIAGGLKINDPAADLAVILSLISSITNIPLDGIVAIGEVGLGGEIRPAAFMEQRVSEAIKLGFTKLVLPAIINTIKMPAHVKVTTIKHVREIKKIFGEQNEYS